MKTERKDPIISDQSLIGREIYFNKFKECEEITYLTANRRYEITHIDTLPMIIDDVGSSISAPLNLASSHLKSRGYWLLAKRTSSKQSVVRTVLGRKL